MYYVIQIHTCSPVACEKPVESPTLDESWNWLSSLMASGEWRCEGMSVGQLIVCPDKQSQNMSQLLIAYLNASDFINFLFVTTTKKIYLYFTAMVSKF